MGEHAIYMYMSCMRITKNVRPRGSECCVRLNRGHAMPKLSGWFGHMFPITTDWHQLLK